MKLKFLWLAFSLIIVSACSDDSKIPEVKKSSANLILTGLQPLTDRFQDTLVQIRKEITLPSVAGRIIESTDSVVVEKSANMQFYQGLASSTCEELVIRIEKIEAIENLRYDSVSKRWDYKSLNDEHHLFFQNYDSAYVEVNLCYLRSGFASGKESDNFKINRLSKVLVNDQEEWLLNITFNGVTVDPYYFDTTPWFEIQEGHFEGVLY